MRDLQVIVATLNDKGAHLAATEQPVDTSTAADKAFFDMLGVFAEFETNLRRERQAEEVAAAKHRGTYRGRPPRIDMEGIKYRLAMGLSPTAIARELEISCGTVYKAKAGMTHIARRSRLGSCSRPGAMSSISTCDTAGPFASSSSRYARSGCLGPVGIAAMAVKYTNNTTTDDNTIADRIHTDAGFKIPKRMCSRSPVWRP